MCLFGGSRNEARTDRGELVNLCQVFRSAYVASQADAPQSEAQWLRSYGGMRADPFRFRS